jgi:anti-anti-sigma factor
MQLLQIEFESQGGVQLSGELDLSTAPQLRDALLPMVRTGGDLVVDLSGVAFIDCAGLRPLLRAGWELKGRGRLILMAPSPRASRLLGLAEADRFPNLEIVDSKAPTFR